MLWTPHERANCLENTLAIIPRPNGQSGIKKTGFVAPVSLSEALERTVRHEFIETHENEELFYSE